MIMEVLVLYEVLVSRCIFDLLLLSDLKIVMLYSYILGRVRTNTNKTKTNHIYTIQSQ